MLNLYKKYKGLIMYGIFGVLTTAINIVVYTLCYQHLQLSNVISNTVAWVLAVLFAYVTNKLFVFESKSFKLSLLLKEVSSFFGCRLLTGALDLLIMWLMVDILLQKAMVWKLISNVLVIVLNFVLSKLLVFKKKTEHKELKGSKEGFATPLFIWTFICVGILTMILTPFLAKIIEKIFSQAA